MTAALRFDPIRLPPECEVLRRQVRAFLADEIAAGTFDPHKPQREDSDAPEFSRRVGERGWLGMTWPKKYGGHERSFLERYVVTEEMRVANAPTRRFFVADRQSGPVLLKYAPEHIKMDILPRICRGEVCFSIGMSEPNSGSDLFAAKTKATKTDGGFLINGSKIWTTSAHIADYMIAIFRTSPPTKENRRHGLTQFLVDMKTPGITVNPIAQLTGLYEFNEVVFENAFMPDDHVLGEIDGAWKQATSELAWFARWDRRRIQGAPKASAGWWHSFTPCGGCRSRWQECCRPARSRWWKPPSSRTSAPSGNSNCRTGCANWRRSSIRMRRTMPRWTTSWHSR
jgi:acyl-CoA dehydrogenase